MEVLNSQTDSGAKKHAEEGTGSVQCSSDGASKPHVVSENINITSSAGCSVDDIPVSRESPDGSSDICDWPATSPANHSSILKTSVSSSSEVQDTLRGNVTGARPKEIYMVQRPKNYVSDLSDDNSGPDKSTSPSLLEVNYEREGDDNSSYCFPPGSHKIQSARHLCNDQFPSTITDSDQESELTVEGILPQTRRRRRLHSPEQPVQLSHKALLNLQGVLHPKATHHIRREKCNSGSNKHCKSCVSVKNDSHKPPEANETGVTSLEVPKHKGGVLCSISVEEAAGGIACSAPSSSIKQHSGSGKSAAKKKKTHSRSRSDGSQEIVNKLQFTHSNTDPSLENAGSFSRLDVSKEQVGRSINVPERKRFMEDGGHSITPAADNGFFPRPQPGQSLIEFLSSKEFHKQNAALDKENAHFNVSEVLIAALTQVIFEAYIFR